MEDPPTNGEPSVPSPDVGRLHVLTDFHLQQQHSHAELARLAIRGGADTIQFRQKHGGIQNILIEARKVAQVCRDASIPLIVDDRIDVMQAVDGDGVHLGQQDFPVNEARSLLGPDTLIGATATKTKQVVEAYEMGADYIGFGPVFPTTSKRNPKSVKGTEGVREASEAVPIPIIAIGGITHDRVRPALEAGAYGVAVLSAVCTANNPERATARFRAAIDGAKTEPVEED
jgi:thiamine-phosphate pyrophosphorylase